MFLIGGPAFSGTTLLTLLVNQANTVCLDEPDFHNPAQSHRGIPFLQTLFPEKSFPERPDKALSYTDAVGLIEACERAIQPIALGIKTCDQIFIDYGEIYLARRYPVVAIIRDIRDALVRPLPPWIDEAGLNRAYRLVWNHLSRFDAWFRYEELVVNTAPIMATLSRVLNVPLSPVERWDSETVHYPMLKLERHEMLKSGAISSSRVGIWKNSGIVFSKATLETAEMMGY